MHTRGGPTRVPRLQANCLCNNVERIITPTLNVIAEAISLIIAVQLRQLAFDWAMIIRPRRMFLLRACRTSSGNRGCGQQSGLHPNFVAHIINLPSTFYPRWNPDIVLCPTTHAAGNLRRKQQRLEFWQPARCTRWTRAKSGRATKKEEKNLKMCRRQNPPAWAFPTA